MIIVDLDYRYKKIEKSVNESVFSVDFIKGKNLSYIGTFHTTRERLHG